MNMSSIKITPVLSECMGYRGEEEWVDGIWSSRGHKILKAAVRTSRLEKTLCQALWLSDHDIRPRKVPLLV